MTLYGIPGRDFQTSDQENPPAAPGTEDGTSDSADETGIYFNHGIYDPSEDNPYFYSSFPLIMTHMQGNLFLMINTNINKYTLK